MSPPGMCPFYSDTSYGLNAHLFLSHETACQKMNDAFVSKIALQKPILSRHVAGREKEQD